MRSFTILSTFSALFFGTIASAAPLGVDNGLGNICTQFHDGKSDVVTNEPVTFHSIIVALNKDVAQPASQLETLTAGNITMDTVTPLVNQMYQAFESATNSLSTLVGQDPARIFSGANGGESLTLNDVATLVGAPVNTALSAATAVVKAFASGTAQPPPLVIISNIVQGIESFLKIVIQLGTSAFSGLPSAINNVIGAALANATKFGIKFDPAAIGPIGSNTL